MTVDDVIQRAGERLAERPVPVPPFERLERARRRRRHTRVSAIAATSFAALSVGVWIVSDDSDSIRSTDSIAPAQSSAPSPTAAPPSTTPSTDVSVIQPDSTEASTVPPLMEPGSFADIKPDSAVLLPPAPIAGRVSPAAVWTGSEMIVWGGSTLLSPSGDAPMSDGAAFNPTSGSWRVIAAAPLEGRSDSAAVWTGTEMVIWGGLATGRTFADGAAYDPATNSWRLIAAAPITAAGRPATAWTGKEMLVIGGMRAVDGGLTPVDGSAAYDPVTDTWRLITSPDGALTTPYPQATWTGDALLMVTEGFPAPTHAAASNLVRYDVTTDEWTAIEEGFDYGLVGLGESGAVAVPKTPDGEGLILDRMGSTVGRVGPKPTDLPPLYGQTVWTGQEILFWAGNVNGIALDPATQSWRTFPAGSVANRVDAALVWADGVMLGWGGFSSNRDGTNVAAGDGVMYRPPSSPEPPATGEITAEEPADPMTISRPFVDPSICLPLAASESSWGEITLEPFAMATDGAIAMQVFADPTLGPEGPIALLLRYSDRPRSQGEDREVVDVNGWRVDVRALQTGNGHALWDLPDGGQAYLRTRDLDRETILALVESLEPRESSADIPGFDLRTDRPFPAGLTMVTEHMNTGLAGRSAAFACTTPDESIWRVWAIDADPVAEYTYLLDRPRPLDVGAVGNTLIIVSGPSALVDNPLVTADDVSNTDPATWQDLLQRPMP